MNKGRPRAQGAREKRLIRGRKVERTVNQGMSGKGKWAGLESQRNRLLLPGKIVFPNSRLEARLQFGIKFIGNLDKRWVLWVVRSGKP